MIRRSTWYALGVLAVALVVAAIWSGSGREAQTTQNAGVPTPSPLWTVESDAVERLVIENGEGQVLLAAARDPSAGWVMQEPQTGPAAAGRLERAVSWLASPPVRAELEAPGDLTPFELDPPRYRVRLATRQGGEQTLVIGRAAPTGDTLYALIPGRTAVVLLSGYGVAEVLGLLEPLPFVPTATVTGATSEP